MLKFQGSKDLQLKLNFEKSIRRILVLRAFTMVSGSFGSLAGPITATSAYELNFGLTNFTPYNARLTTLAHQIK